MKALPAPLATFAADYDCNTYGSGKYDTTHCASTSAVGAPDTGVMGVIGSPYLIGGVLLVAIAVVLAVRQLRAKKQ